MSHKPKIAVLIDWYLPGTKAGGPVRSVFSLVSLLNDDVDFYVLTTNKDLGSEQEYEGIKPNTVFKSENINYCYFSEDHFSQENILETIRKINPDLVYVNSFWSYPFSISIVRAKKTKRLAVPILLAPRGMLSPGALGLKSFKKRSFLLLSKLFGWYNTVRFHATNEQEKKEILSEFPNAKVAIAPNLNAIKPVAVLREKHKNRISLFYLSRIARVKNLHFALEVLSGVPSHIKVNYDIFGNIEDNVYWEQCKKLISGLPENITVNYKRELKFDEIQHSISVYHALFLPTLNENFGHSIVESMASGCVVLISDQTPWSDVASYSAGYALNLKHKTAFIETLTELASLDQHQFAQKSKNAIAYISEKLNLEKSRKQYITLFNESIKN